MGTTVAIVAAGFAVALVGAAVGSAVMFFRAFPGIPDKQKAPRRKPDTYLEELSARIAAVETEVRGIPSLYDEILSRWELKAKRIEQANRDAEKRIERERERSEEEQEELEFESPDVLEGNGEARVPEGLLGLSANVGERSADDVKARAAEALRLFGRR